MSTQYVFVAAEEAALLELQIDNAKYKLKSSINV